MRIFISLFAFVVLYSCTTTTEVKAQKATNLENVTFQEERRLNKDFDSKEIFIVSTMDEVTNLYGKLQDPQFKRSAPIPVIEAGESLLVIKPKASVATDYSDIEVQSIQKDEKNIVVKYKKVENLEYKDAKQTHPVLILKINSSPKNLILKEIK